MFKMGTSSKKLMLFAALVIVLSTVSAADYTVSDADWGVINGIRPTFQLDFNDEPDDVYLTSFNLTNSSGGFVDYFTSPSETQPSKTYTFGPKDSNVYLRNNMDYTFSVTYRDDAVPPNYRTSIYTFTIQHPDLNITVYMPRFGITPFSSVNLTIRTVRNAVCNYSFSGYNSGYSFDSTGGLEHKKQGASIGGTTSLYVQCRDNYRGIYQKTIQLILDSSNPSISASANDVTEFPLEANLVVSANEPVICRFHNSSTVFSEMINFDGYNDADETQYKSSHIQNLDSQYITNSKTNRFFVVCKDKSGRLSNLADISFNVDTSASETITIHYPSGALSSNILRFNATTNKNADYCEYSNRSDAGFVIFSSAGKTHISSNLGILQPKSYTYYVQCRFHNESGVWFKSASTNFVIDDTAPYMVYINMTYPLDNYTGKTYKTDEICADWRGEDDESSIDLYGYYVYRDTSTDELIDYGTESYDSDDEYCIDGLELNDSQSYYIQVSAKNAVGLWSSNMTSSTILVDTSLSPAGCRNNRKDGSETDIDCGGSCTDCGIGKSCSIDTDCSSNFCNSSNKCASASCNDDIRNGKETDVDCGGSCKKCEVDQYCSKNSDCKTNNCDVGSGKCEAVSNKCENDLLDVGETDIDCGGSCPLCGIGKSCDSSADCISSAECKNGVCTGKAGDSDGDGVKDDTDNCPDKANADQSDVDNDGQGDVCDNDSDNDGLPDSFEQQYFDCVTCVNPDDDPDEDGLTNLDEYTRNTNPIKKDTDGDGYGDKEEIDNGTDPLDPSSYPGGVGWLAYLLMILGLGGLGAGGYFGYTLLIKKDKPFIPPPSAPVAKPQLKRPLMRPRAPIRPHNRPPVMAHRIPNTPNALMRPTLPMRPVVQKAAEPIKPKIKILEKEKKEDIFSRLSAISKADRKEQVQKHINSLKMNDKELKERIERLKKDLKIPIKR